MGYTSINLHPESQKRLVDYYNGNIQNIPEDWEIIAHHMTINMSSMAFGPLKDYTMGELEKLCNQDQELKVVSYAMDDKVMAVGVETELPSKNKIKHITVAVNREAGGKPFLSNQLTAWESVVSSSSACASFSLSPSRSSRHGGPQCLIAVVC